MKTLKKIVLSFILSVAATINASAEITMCPLFTDNMVLQQHKQILVGIKM